MFQGMPWSESCPTSTRPHPLLEDGTSISKAKPNLKYTSHQSSSALKPMTFSCLMSIKRLRADAQWGNGADIASCVVQVLVWERKVKEEICDTYSVVQNNLQKLCTKCLLNRLRLFRMCCILLDLTYILLFRVCFKLLFTCTLLKCLLVRKLFEILHRSNKFHLVGYVKVLFC